jgi:SH3-like domain-containing protein
LGWPADRVNAPKAKVPVPVPSLTLYASEDELALRADAAMSGFLIKRLPAGIALTVLEPKDTALAKVGQYNQWFQVQDPTGEQGFVAAWYVATSHSGSPAPTNTPGGATTTPDNELTLAPTSDGLALREQPDVSGNLIKRLPITALLKVLEPAGDAAKKLGTQGQWIRVRDITGSEGYVAAWYVTAVDNPAIGVKTPADGPPTPSQNLIVRTAADQVALRRTPGVADDNLIKRLPLRAELLVLEPGAEAKIGVQDQWLRVKDLDGAEGYVAAWYVSK